MFKKYNSIENTYREEFLERIKAHGFWNEEYVVQEKAHGANLSFWTQNGIDFFAGKRTAQLDPDENFHNFGEVLETIKPNLQAIWKSLKAKEKDLKQLSIFGELIGGSYPHNEVARNKNASKVQKGVFYSPDNCFYAYDILLDAEYFLDITKSNQLFEQFDLLHAKSLFQGSLENCLTYSNTFDSLIPAMLGLPPITPNICEGVVIKPIKNLYLRNGTRVILKNKNEKWAEVMRSRKRIPKQIEVPEYVRELQELIAGYVTENRLNNVISKIGEFTNKDFGKLLGLLNKDVVEDFTKDYGDRFNQLDKKERKMVTKSIGKASAKIIRKNYF